MSLLEERRKRRLAALKAAEGLARWAALALPDGWLVAGILTSNPLTPYIDLFDQKAGSYCTRWPSLRVVRGDV